MALRNRNGDRQNSVEIFGVWHHRNSRRRVRLHRGLWRQINRNAKASQLAVSNLFLSRHRTTAGILDVLNPSLANTNRKLLPVLKNLVVDLLRLLSGQSL